MSPLYFSLAYYIIEKLYLKTNVPLITVLLDIKSIKKLQVYSTFYMKTGKNWIEIINGGDECLSVIGG